jgi:hypothetical protein
MSDLISREDLIEALKTFDEKFELQKNDVFDLITNAPAIEQGEAVTKLWESLGRWSAYLASNGEQAELSPPSWLIDAVKNATTPQQPRPLFVGIDYSKDYVAEKVADALEEAIKIAKKYCQHGRLGELTVEKEIRALIKRNAEPKECKWCNGAGVVETGIDELPVTICNRCDGMGTIAPKEGE